ncbi:MAG TPA: hypothetical protein VKT99_07315 [Xanthobacteraceae bacterium]|jgi:hypothetical protein|nr:hypothetical protein [Xanthobacteraceae bacterium]
MQRATLVAWITGAMLVLSTIVAGMTMVQVIGPAALAQVDSNILLVPESMLNVNAHQRRDARGLRQHKQDHEKRTEAPQLSRREWLRPHHLLLSIRLRAWVKAGHCDSQVSAR